MITTLYVPMLTCSGWMCVVKAPVRFVLFREGLEMVTQDSKPIFKPRKYMTDEELKQHLLEFDDLGFDDLPKWIQLELKARRLHFECRSPTELEMWETNKDAREHRITNKELTIDDYLDKYKRGKSLTLIT